MSVYTTILFSVRFTDSHQRGLLSYPQCVSCCSTAYYLDVKRELIDGCRTLADCLLANNSGRGQINGEAGRKVLLTWQQ